MSDDVNEPKGRARGALALARSMTPEQLSARGQRGAAARWGKGLVATHKGNFKAQLGLDVECYVLNDATKTAVISQTGMARALGMASRGSVFPRFISSQAMAPFVGIELDAKLKNPLVFQLVTPSIGQPAATANGFDAVLLIDVCNAIAAANAAGSLSKRYEKIVQQAAIITGAAAKSGIRGLVYALAGYNPSADEVISAFKQYIRDEAREYEREFPEQLYEEWYRLYKLPKPERNKPWKFMHLTINQVYHPLARSSGRILKLTQEQRAIGEARNKRLHLFLSEVGVKALRTQLGQLLGIARISKSEEEYEAHFQTLFGEQPDLFKP